MLRLFWQLTRGYRLRPWRSPYLRWRIETYWGWPAAGIGFRQFWAFVWQQRRELARYARWAAVNRQHQARTEHPNGEDRARNLA
jgi:hypothetical protein